MCRRPCMQSYNKLPKRPPINNSPLPRLIPLHPCRNCLFQKLHFLTTHTGPFLCTLSNICRQNFL